VITKDKKKKGLDTGLDSI